MASIQDNKGYNQGFKPSRALTIRMERRCDYMLSKMDIRSDTRILEIGCGTGLLSFLMARKSGCEVTGIDICEPFIASANKEYNIGNLKFMCFDFTSKHEIDRFRCFGEYDYIVGNGILHHLYYRLEESLVNVRSMLKTPGKIVFLEPNVLNPYCFLIFKIELLRRAANLDPLEMAFAKKSILEVLEKAGYIDSEVLYRDFLLPNTPSFFVKPAIAIGTIAEKLPGLNRLAQSIYISASNGGK